MAGALTPATPWPSMSQLMNALRRKPLFVALFLIAVACLQARALLEQFRLGFVPFRSPPVRVAFSWDMFAIPIARCDIEWDPPVPVGRGYRHLRDIGSGLEWDPVYNAPANYLAAAQAGCRLRKAATRARLTCVTPQGVFEHGFECP